MSQWIDKNLVVLTGAGISAESGIRTFRDSGGLWENHRLEDVATPEAFAKNPSLVHRFYNARRAQLSENGLEPNAAHFALSRLEQAWQGRFTLVTQNVDDLHQRSGSKNCILMHGQLRRIRCLSCESTISWKEDLFSDSECPRCSVQGQLRPDIVWFGEIPYELETIQNELESCDLFVAIGTSGQVYPAAGFVSWVPSSAWTVEINPEQTAVSSGFRTRLTGAASKEVPKFVDALISGDFPFEK